MLLKQSSVSSAHNIANLRTNYFNFEISDQNEGISAEVQAINFIVEWKGYFGPEIPGVSNVMTIKQSNIDLRDSKYDANSKGI